MDYRGYLIPFATHAFASERQLKAQSTAFATGVPPDLYAFHHYTGNSVLLYLTQVKQSHTASLS